MGKKSSDQTSDPKRAPLPDHHAEEKKLKWVVLHHGEVEAEMEDYDEEDWSEERRDVEPPEVPFRKHPKDPEIRHTS